MSEMRLRKERIDVTGRSAIFNILGILINIIGLIFVVKGYHDSTAPENVTLYKIIGFSLMAFTLVSLFIFKGLYLFSFVARAFVGGLFIVSGLVKANDPWGFAFKLEEYFEPNGLAYDFPFFESLTPYVLELSILICVVEIVLGVAVIVGGKIKLVSWSLVFMMAGFTWLTFYTASCNEAQSLAMDNGEEFTRQCVLDCGCFGDALRGSVGRSLTPIESFWKDLILFYFVIIIFINQWKIKLNSLKENWVMVPASMLVVIFFSWVFGWMFPIFFALIALLGAFIVANLNIGKLGKAWKMAIFVTLVSLIFSIYTSSYLPIKDYRPYAIGNNLIDQMKNGVDEIAEFKFQYKNKQTGEIEEFDANDYQVYGDTSKYEYHDRIKKVIVAGVPASIQDFMASINYEQLNEEIKANPFIDSLIQADYSFYYEEKMIVSGPYGNDTISIYDYDTTIYPDSLYRASEPFTALSDPNMPFMLNVTPYLLSAETIFIMTIRDIKNIDYDYMSDFAQVYNGAKEMGIPFFVISPADNIQIEEFYTKAGFAPTFLSFDGTEVKIPVRSNPGLMLLQSAVVKDKWPFRSVPDFEDIKQDYLEN